MEPSTRRPPRRSRRAQFESERCARLVAVANAAPSDAPAARSSPSARSRRRARERRPSRARRPRRCAARRRTLEVVGEHERDADEHERHQPDADRAHAPEADRGGAGERDRSRRDERGGGQEGGERAAVELVEAVRGDADREQERDQRPGQAARRRVLREARAERDVGEVPGGVGRVQQRDAVAEAAGPQRVERDAPGVTGQRAPPRRRDRRPGSAAARARRPPPRLEQPPAASPAGTSAPNFRMLGRR